MTDPERKTDAADAPLTSAAIPRRRSWVELSVGLAALVVSVASLFVARHQALVMDRQLAASVWPLLEYSSSNATPTGEPRAVIMLRNTGIGPLRIRSFRATYEGRPITGGTDFIERCCARDTVMLRRMAIVTSYVGGRVVPAGEAFDVIAVRFDTTLAPAFRDIQRALLKIETRYCYCSVLDDCWVRESERPDADPEPVPSCDGERRGAQFRI